MTSQALSGVIALRLVSSEGSPSLLEVRHTHTHSHGNLRGPIPHSNRHLHNTRGFSVLLADGQGAYWLLLQWPAFWSL